MEKSYPSPVDRLLTYGDPRQQREWPNYLELGLTEAHVPDLIRMATDPDLNWAESEPVWAAPIHAWRALGQLRAAAAAEPLLDLLLLRNSKEEYGYDDWSGEELPEVFGMLGPAAIPAAKAYLTQHAGDNDEYPEIAAEALVKIAQNYPDTRAEIVGVLTDQLAKFETNAYETNGWIIANLVDLQAVESAAVIRSAFAADQVDLSINGNWRQVRDALHLDPAIEFPGPEPENKPIPPLFSWIGQDRELSAIEPSMRPAASTGQPRRKPSNKKAKKKQAKQSRRQNRKRK